MKKSRRQFLKLVAAGSAAAIAGASRGSLAHETVLAAGAAARRTRGTPATFAAPTAAVRAEIQRQKEQTATALGVIRDYPLPTGSPMAFAFAPLKAERGRKRR